MHKTKNESMGVLKLKLDITPENIESLKALFLKPENKTSDVISAGTMLFNGKPIEKSVEDLPTVATLRTQFGFLQEGDIAVSKSNNHSVYIGIVTKFTDKTIYMKNVTNVFTSEAMSGIGIQCGLTYSFLVEELAGFTKNQ